MSYAPVIIFTYSRPNHTKKVLDALYLNPEAQFTNIYIYCDGVKDKHTSIVNYKIKSKIIII
jgi:hypothetical protein